MYNILNVRKLLASILLLLLTTYQTVVYAQVSVVATGGTPASSYTDVSSAFAAINSGIHSGDISIFIDGNTAEPATPVILAASGQSTASYTSVTIKPTVLATISGATTAGSGVLNFDGCDNVTIDGSIAVGGTTRDLTIENTAANSVANTAAIRLFGRTTLGLGINGFVIKNCHINGSTSGNNGLSGSTVTTTYGIYAGSVTAGTMSSSGSGSDYDNITIQNNEITRAYIGAYFVGGTSAMNDNLVVTDNTIGSLVNPIGFKGFIGQQLAGGSFAQNTVFGITNTNGVNLAGVEVGGSATTGFQVRRNTIYGIDSQNTGGWGAYGVNVTNGTGVIVANNVIYGVRTVNYTLSTTYQAFGIRLSGGTGHGIYYNSIHMYGDYSNTNYTVAFSAAMVVTATSVTGLEIRNNIFSNIMTSNATTQEFAAIQFVSGYNFLNANIDNNAYLVPNNGQHYMGKTGTVTGAGLYSDLAAWRALTQVNNATNDVNSIPSSNSVAPFTSNTDLTIPAGTVTLIESGGIPITSLGLPNPDHDGISRPAGTGTNPDMGAYEFEGTLPADTEPPVIVSANATPGASCTLSSHLITADITDNVGVTTVTLNYSYDGVAQTPVTMTLASGNATSGTYTGTIPAAPGAEITVSWSVVATDGYSNVSLVYTGASYTDQYLNLVASPDFTITTSTPTQIQASINIPQILISEVIQYKTGTGDGTYPAYVPAADNDFVELINIGITTVDVSGYSLTLYGGVNGSFTIPAGTSITAGGTLVLAFSGNTVDPANNYFGMGLATTSSGVQNGYALRNSFGAIEDAVATNGYTFSGASGVTSAHWAGNLPSSSGLAGVRRVGATDTDNASDWLISGASNLTNIGVYNVEVTQGPVNNTITWTPGGSTQNPLPLVFPTSGVYTYTASYTDGICTVTEDVVITVLDPVTPVAAFTATPLSGNAPLTVAFTDQSTNYPNTWSWTISPAAGVTFVSGTSNTDQNPIVQFANQGTYTITLLAGNAAGSDDSTIVQYIDVDWCLSGATNTADTDIGNVTFGPLNNGTATPIFSNPAANGTYTDYTGLPLEMYGVGMTYPMSVSQITGGTTFYDAYVNVFIDFNNDGELDPITERVLSGPTSSSGPANVVSGNVTIPVSAVMDTVLMRVIINESGNASSSPCGTFSYGETEDYLIILTCATAAPAVASTSICAGQSVNLTAAGNSVQWYADDLGSPAIGSGGSFSSGALTSDTSFWVSAKDPTCVESVLSEVFVAVSQPGYATVNESACGSFTWPLDGNTYTASGTYTATLVNAAGCDSVVTLNLSINTSNSGTDVISSCDPIVWIDGSTYSSSNNTATWTLTNAAGCDSVVTLDLTITAVNNGVTQNQFTLTADQSGATYQWINCADNTPVAGETGQSFNVSVTGNYAAVVTMNGCSDTTSCVYVDLGGLDELSAFNLKVAPNPAHSVVTLYFDASEAFVQVVDVHGKKMLAQNWNSGVSADISGWAEGVYLLHITIDGKQSVRRLVKQ